MPFKADLDRCPIDVPADTYMYVTDHSPVAAVEAASAAELAASAAELAASKYESLISAQVTVPASVKTLAELLAAVVTTAAAEDLVASAAIGTLTYSGTVAPHPAMEIDPDTFDVTITLTTDGAQTVADDGAGALLYDNDPIFVTGTIDYETGAWTLVIVGDTVVDASAITVTYDWFFTVPAATPAQGLWMSPGAADEIYATYSENGVPTAATGILLAEPVFLAGQPNLIANAKFIGNDTLMDVEVMI